MVDINEEQENEYERVNCPMCEKLDIYPIPKLGPKILLDGAKPQPDHENWLQCPSCAWICPIYEAKYEQNLHGFAQTSDDPFESQKGIVESIPNRTSVAGKKQLEKRKRERLRAHHDDPEIDALLTIYGEENVRIIQDTSV